MRKLYRSTRDRKLFGVCGGLADYLGVDATLLRILLVIVTVFSGGTVLFVYIIAGFIIPRDSDFGGNAFGSPPPSQGGWAPPPHSGGWTPPQQRPPAPPASSWNSGGAWPGPGPAAPAAKPAPQAAAASPSTAPTLDAMMEDIEKKALKKEIEDLKARITKFEQQSKGE
ncbi:PspC domain-containing protein [Cohnella sp. 56]|uniref:PspC domain-containing protein n=1 Tax=Cohnella sp. 56 TaxID=3113722 RepID=UPI0030EACA35